MKNFKNFISLPLFYVACLFFAGCNSKFEVTLSDQIYSDSVAATAKTRKVLYLIVDGARGLAVRDANAPTINSLLKNSTYSWYSLSDSLANDPTGWTDLMAGVTKLKHKVETTGFTTYENQKYPVFFKLIKNAKPGMRISSFASSAEFNDNLTSGADVRMAYSTDAEVKSAVVSELGNDSASVIVGQFKNVNTVGALNTSATQNGYEISIPEYRNAILEFDSYLGEIMTALKARRNYAKEDWLVVITSNHGGPASIPAAQDDNTVLSYPKVNTFTILHNARYKQKQIIKPFAGNKFPGKFLRFYASAVEEAKAVYGTVSNNNGIYNFGENTAFTIEAKIRKPSSANQSWPIFLSKKAVSTDRRNGAGWSLALENSTWRFLMVNGSNAQTAMNGLPITDVNWHHIAVSVYTNTDGRRVVRTFQDGKRVSNTDVLSIPKYNIDNSGSLKIGFYQTVGSDGAAFNGFLSDIRIWKVNLPDSTIANFACDTRVTAGHPYYHLLLGNWLLTEGTGTTLKDQSMANNDFNVKVGTGTTLQWTDLNNILCPPSTSNLGVLVPRTYDFPRQILSWLTLPIPETYNLDGRVWLNN